MSAESLDNGIKKLGKSISETALLTPTSTAADAFRAMGISQDFLRENSNNLEAVLMKMADAFHDHTAGAQADAIAMAAFGRAGVEMIPWLSQSSEKIAEQVQRFKEPHGELTGPMSDAMKENEQAAKDLGAAWGGYEQKITNAVLPALTKLYQSLTDIKGLAVSIASTMTGPALAGTPVSPL